MAPTASHDVHRVAAADIPHADRRVAATRDDEDGKEVDDLAAHDAVDQVADRATEDQRQPPERQSLHAAARQLPDNQGDHRDDHGEQCSLRPRGTVGEKRERDAAVAGVDEAEQADLPAGAAPSDDVLDETSGGGIGLPHAERVTPAQSAEGFPEPPWLPGQEALQQPLWTDLAEEAASDRDELYVQAVEEVRKAGRASVSLLQRRLRIGYSRAARLIDQLEQDGVVGPDLGGSRGRDVLPQTMSDQSASSKASRGGSHHG